MHFMKKLVLPLTAVLLSACAQLPKPAESGKPTLSSAEAQARYQQGLAHYKATRYDAALGDFDVAISSGKLQSEDMLNARKHSAFVHCGSGREVPCREQFQAILKAQPAFDLAPGEAGNPAWGPVWRSVKGAMEEQRAVKQASSTQASASQQKLAEGIREYDAGRYKEAIDALQASLRGGLPGKPDEIRAHKYSAFAYCLTQRTTLCRGEFRKIFAIDGAFDLLPSESGHPAWASVYRKEKAAARHAPKKK
ncbi:MAG: hypothetical protein V7642_5170 [Burkholderiales bacterium]|jgi:tetratricopeptide (TPR) repeat protein